MDHPVYGPVYAIKELPDGREAIAAPMIYTTQIKVGAKDAGYFDDMW